MLVSSRHYELCTHLQLTAVRAMFIRGLLIPTVSLVMMWLPMSPVRHATESMKYGRILWIPIAAWLLLCILPVSHILAEHCADHSTQHLPLYSTSRSSCRLYSCRHARFVLSSMLHPSEWWIAVHTFSSELGIMFREIS